jgi:hypothetical protein
MPRLGPYSKEIKLAQPDMRTREGRLLKQIRAKLTEQVGGSPSYGQQALIERLAWLQLRCAALDQRILDGSFTEYDSKTYLAWCSTLARLMARLDGAAPEPADDVSLAAIHDRLRETAA